MERVSGVFLTDSVHFGLTGHDELDTKLKAVGVNYVSSDQPLGMDVHKGISGSNANKPGELSMLLRYMAFRFRYCYLEPDSDA